MSVQGKDFELVWWGFSHVPDEYSGMNRWILEPSVWHDWEASARSTKEWLNRFFAYKSKI